MTSTPAVLKSLVISITGTEIGWHAATVRLLGMANSRTLRRWIDKADVPDWAIEKLTEIASTAGTAIRDEWVVGVGQREKEGEARLYIMHQTAPRFVARIVKVDNDGSPLPYERPVNIVASLFHQIDSHAILCSLEPIDDIHPSQISLWLNAAATAYRQHLQ